MRILMVCLGNICRSPLAEGIMKQKIKEHGLNWEVDSAGTGTWHIGERPDSRSISIARQYGLDITGQRARQINPSDLQNFDLVLAMDSSNYMDIKTLAKNPEQADKVQLIMNFAHPGRNQNVPDPYWDDDGFDRVYKMLDEACKKIVENYSLMAAPKA